MECIILVNYVEQRMGFTRIDGALSHTAYRLYAAFMVTEIPKEYCTLIECNKMSCPCKIKYFVFHDLLFAFRPLAIAQHEHYMAISYCPCLIFCTFLLAAMPLMI